MSDLEEGNEGRKDARKDRVDNKKKPWNLNTHTQPYINGYDEEWENTKPVPPKK